MRTATTMTATFTGAVALLLGGMALPAASAGDPPLEYRTGDLTSRPAGLPSPSSVPAQRLASAQVRQEVLADRVSGTFKLRGTPTAATSSTLMVAFGHRSETTCVSSEEWSTPVTGTMATGFVRSGDTVTLSIAEPAASHQDWDCAFATLSDTAAPATTYDALIGGLTDVRATPRLSVGQPEVLHQKAAKLRLVRNAWVTVRVPVDNVGQADAERVTVSGRGTGLRVQGASAKIWAGSSSTFVLRVKRVAARSGPLRITASAAGAPAARRTVRTVAVNPPPRPQKGSYRNKSGSVTFRITGGRKPRITGFRVKTLTTCGGFPDTPTFAVNHYNFPASPIGRDGTLDRTQKTELYSVSLSLRASRGKVTSGRFSYGGPNRCRAVETFTATRKR